MRRSAAERRSPEWQERNQWGDFFLAGLESRALIEEIYSSAPTYSLLPFSPHLRRHLTLLGGYATVALIDHLISSLSPL